MTTFKTPDTLTDQERELAAMVLREYADELEKVKHEPGSYVTGAWEIRNIAHKLEWGS